MRAFIQKNPLLYLMLLASLMVLAFQGTRGILEPDEGRYSNAALQMLQHNDWVSIYRNQDSLHFTKPPLTYWLIAGSVAVFGHNEWAVRLPMALTFLLSIFLTYHLGKIFTPKRSWLPAVFLLCSPIAYFASNTVNTDGVLAALLTLAMLCFCKAQFSAAKPIWLDAMWLAFGLAFLTKGPPALLPLLAVVAFMCWQKQSTRLLRPVGILLFCAVGFTWYVLVIYRHPGLLDYFLGHEVVDRIATDKHNRNGEWYGALKIYIPTLLIGLSPALLYWLANKKHTAAQITPEPDWQQRFLWLWFLIPLAIFCLSRSRLPLYILSLLVPAILLLTKRLQTLEIKPRAIALALIWCMAILAIKGVASHWIMNHNKKDSRAFAAAIQPLLPGHPNQIIFVDDMARNGLNLYFQTNIKKVSFDEKPQTISDSAYDSSLATELSGARDQRIFIMKRELEARFIRETVRHNQLAIKLGEWQEKSTFSPRDRMIYTLDAEFSQQKAR